MAAAWASDLYCEVAKFKGLDAIGLFADLQKFYDHIGFDHLIADAVACEFPLNLLLLTIEMYRTPVVSRSTGAAQGSWSHTTRSSRGAPEPLR